MRVIPLLLGLVLAGVSGCSEPETASPPAVPTTTAPRAPMVTTPAPEPEPAVVPDTPPTRHGQGRARLPRAPRMSRQAVRSALGTAIAARRPDRPLPPGELDRLTNQAMRIRVMRSRLARMREGAEETPRAQKLRERIDAEVAAFQTGSGVMAADLGPILEPAPPPARRL